MACCPIPTVAHALSVQQKAQLVVFQKKHSKDVSAVEALRAEACRVATELVRAAVLASKAKADKAAAAAAAARLADAEISASAAKQAAVEADVEDNLKAELKQKEGGGTGDSHEGAGGGIQGD